ncbi:hypothetical protein [Terriglobus sp.]|uniref:hypothetical protein n=1 Tax=Terriglobus sp. TaxID=1889013 RepID=UPI003B00DD62
MKPRPAHISHADAAGFAVSAGGQQRQVRWDQVERVTAFKRDLYTVDMLCLLILLGEDQAIFELNEQMEGYNEFVAAMDIALPGAMPWAQWFMAVAFPAFATNPLCIYRRGGEPDPIPSPPPEEPEPKLSLIQRAIGHFWDFALRPLERQLYRSGKISRSSASSSAEDRTTQD